MQNKLFSYGFMEKLLPLFVVFALFAMCYLWQLFIMVKQFQEIIHLCVVLKHKSSFQ